MTKKELMKKIARLESMRDLLESEISHVDTLLRAVGFPGGLASAKEVALEIVAIAEKESVVENEG